MSRGASNEPTGSPLNAKEADKVTSFLMQKEQITEIVNKQITKHFSSSHAQSTLVGQLIGSSTMIQGFTLALEKTFVKSETLQKDHLKKYVEKKELEVTNKQL